ncbi:MAG: hypothetical protein AB7E52_06670 [Bdellovibrionales bacterium]
MDVASFDDKAVLKIFNDLGQLLRSRRLDLGRTTYSLPLALGIREALQCGYDKLSVIEFGVAAGAGLLDLCKAAHYFRDTFGMDIRVYGFDTGSGLPELHGYRDHPELWHQGKYAMEDPDRLRAKLPPFAELIIGDIGETLVPFQEKLEEHPLAFVSVDVDFYSSAVKTLPVFTGPADHYLPAVPIYFDDILQLFMYHPWAGESLAVSEFNEAQAMRKIAAKPHFNMVGLHACHVLDHPICQGEQKARFPLMGRTI